MSSLREILAAHTPLLLLDAASARVQVGWLAAGEAWRWETSTAEAGVGLFSCVAGLQCDVAQARGFVFCDGPGSILGIRTAAMAIRTWNVLSRRPTFAYTSLAIVAHALADPRVAVIADARRESSHRYQIGVGLQRVAASELHGELVMPDDFRNWSPLPTGIRRVPYVLSTLLLQVIDKDLLSATDAPDAFLHQEPSYVTWTPQIHRPPPRT